MVRPAGRSAAVLRRLLPAHPGPRRRRVAPASARPPQRARMLGRELGCRRRVRTGRLRGGQREPPAGHAARADVLAGAGPGAPGRGGRGPRPGHRSARAGGKERQRPADVQRAGRPRVHCRVARRLPGGARTPGPAGTPGRRRGPGPAERGQVPAGRDRGAGRPRGDRPRRGAPAAAAHPRTGAARPVGAGNGGQVPRSPGREWPAITRAPGRPAHRPWPSTSGCPCRSSWAGRCSPRASPSGGRGASRRRESRSARRWPSSSGWVPRSGRPRHAGNCRRRPPGRLRAGSPRPSSGLPR